MHIIWAKACLYRCMVYGETQIVDFKVCSHTVLYMAECGNSERNHIHSMKYVEVINDIRTRT